MKFPGKKSSDKKTATTDTELDNGSGTSPATAASTNSTSQQGVTKEKKQRKLRRAFRRIRKAARSRKPISPSDVASVAGSMSTTTTKHSVADDSTFHDMDEADYQQEEWDPFNYHFRQVLKSIFTENPNQTTEDASLTEDQMREIHASIAADYTEILIPWTSHEDDSDELVLHMRCASHVLRQFWDVQRKSPSILMSDQNQKMVFECLDDYIFPNVMFQLSPPNNGETMSPDKMAKTITWMYTMEIETKRVAPHIVLRQEWLKERSKLFEQYLERAVRHKMTILLMEVLKLHSHDDIRVDGEGQLVTGLPEQISYIVNQQLLIASECLPPPLVEDVLVACNETLYDMINDWTFRISTEWTQMSTDFFCATINDTSRLNEYCDDCHEEYLAQPELSQSAANISRHIAEFSLHATKYLCERIIHDLREPNPTLTLAGSEVWESPDSPSIVECTVETFKDYFTDVESWILRDYFFPKVLKNCFDLALQTYLESFFANTMVDGVNDATVAAAELEQDYLRFVGFFNGEQFIKYHGHGGFYTQKAINDRLRILQHMAALIDPTNLPTYLSYDVQRVLQVFGREDDGEAAVLHLIGLRGHTARNKSVYWLKIIASCQKELATKSSEEKTDLSCRIPDLRNSKMLRKIAAPPRAVIPREISEGSIPYVESATRLLKKPNRFAVSPVSAALMRSRNGEHGSLAQREHVSDLKVTTPVHEDEPSLEDSCGDKKEEATVNLAVTDDKEDDIEEREVSEDNQSRDETYFEGRMLVEI